MCANSFSIKKIPGEGLFRRAWSDRTRDNGFKVRGEI